MPIFALFLQKKSRIHFLSLPENELPIKAVILTFPSSC